MRGYQTQIQQAELMAMAPWPVAEFLRRRASQSKDEARNDPIDEEVERALRSRGDPLIDLSLARYGRHMEVASELFLSGGSGSPTRLACLANRSLGLEIFNSFPVGLLGREPEPMAEWLVTASDDELCALFENPTLSDSFLCDLLERDKGWESIADDRLCRFVSILHRNPRMRTPREDGYMDGSAEYSYGSVFNAAWKLAETAPATDGWAAALGWLYEQLEPDAFSIDEPLRLAERWRVDPADAKEAKKEAANVAIGYLGDKQRVRKGLARLALSKSHKLLGELVSNDDVALRCAAYSAGSLNADQLRAGYERDGELAFNESLRNLALWKRQESRQALHDIAWSVVGADKQSDLTAANFYNWMEKDTREKHPAWFAEAEGEPLGDDEVNDQSPATQADISTLAGHMERQAQSVDAVGQALRTLTSRTGWIWWFSLGALLASLWRF
jgi:hypothetical protein